MSPTLPCSQQDDGCLHHKVKHCRLALSHATSSERSWLWFSSGQSVLLHFPDMLLEDYLLPVPLKVVLGQRNNLHKDKGC